MKKPTVLVIDDSRTNQAIIEDFLESGGMRSISASDAASGTALAIARRPDAIVLDVVLPDADGIRLCQQWREDPRLKDTPVLLISGLRLRDEDRAAGLRSGAMGYLSKPFSEVELLAQVNLLCQLGRTYGKLKQRNRELEESNRELQQFATVVSHDLKEPLRSVACYCQALERRYGEQLDAEAREFIRMAVDGAADMDRFIDDLLIYSRVGRIERPLEAVALDEVVGRVLQTLQGAIRESGAAVRFDSLPVVLGSPRLLSRLFQNLIGNAIKFRGKVAPQITISSEKRGNRQRITVADNGIGIRREYLGRIFGVGKRLHTRDEYPGTGIGLAICRRIVHRHGGRIRVESEPGHGTAFHLVLVNATGEEHRATKSPSPKRIRTRRSSVHAGR